MATYKILMALSTLPHLKALKILAPRLSEENFVFEYLEDGTMLLETVTDFQPDLILIDYRLERFHYTDAIRAIRQLPDFESKPILVTSYLSFSADMVMSSIEAGANDIINLPLKVKEILEKFISSINHG